MLFSSQEEAVTKSATKASRISSLRTDEQQLFGPLFQLFSLNPD